MRFARPPILSSKIDDGMGVGFVSLPVFKMEVSGGGRFDEPHRICNQAGGEGVMVIRSLWYGRRVWGHFPENAEKCEHM